MNRLKFDIIKHTILGIFEARELVQNIELEKQCMPPCFQIQEHSSFHFHQLQRNSLQRWMLE